MGQSMLRRMFSSKARQCIKAIARRNPHPRAPINPPRMNRRCRQFLQKTAALLLACMVALAALPALAAAKNPYGPDPGPPPPQGNPLNIEVPRGRAVLITLSAYSLTSPIIRFRIKRGAEAGKVGIPKFASASTAVVRYQPPDGAGPGDDSFWFAVQSEAGVSAPVEVTIKITDKDPLFVAPTELEFGQVLVGGSAVKTLELQNLGGGLAEGTVKVPDGWTVQGDADYHLGRGEKQDFALIFTPADEQGYTGDIEYTGNEERATDLSGEGVGPLAVTTTTVNLAQAGEMRTGMIHLVNHTNGALPVKLKPGGSIRTDSTATVPANGGVDITVNAAGNDAVDDHVTVEGEGLRMDVAVHADAANAYSAPDIAAAATPPPPPRETAPKTSPGPTTVVQVADAAAAPDSAPDSGAFPSMTLPPLNAGAEDNSQPEPMQVVLLHIGRVSQTHAEVGSDFKGCTQAQSYRLELQTLGFDSQDHAVIKWIPFPGATLTTRGQMVIAQIPDLQPGTLYVVRLVGLDDQADVIEMSTAGAVTTAPAPPPWWQRWLPEEVGVVVLIGAAWWWKGKTTRGYRARR